MLPYVGIKLQEQIGDVLAGIHSQLRFVLAVSLDEPSRRAALDGQPALAFKLP